MIFKIEKKWIIGFIFLGLIVFFLFVQKNNDSDASKKSTIQNENLENGKLLKLVESSEQRTDYKSSHLSEYQIKEIKKCFSNLEFHSSLNLHQAISSIAKKIIPDLNLDEFLGNQVYHLKLPNKEERRLRIYSEKGLKRLAFYSVDQDGDPQLLDVPAEHQILPTPNMIQDYLNLGEIVHSEKEYLVKLADQEQLELKQEDSYFVEIQFKQLGKMFGCNKKSCRCIN
jgi:hypothetical protein